MNKKNLLLAAFLPLLISGCSLFRATGETVEAVGHGTAHAVSRTGEAVDDAADGIADTLTP